MSTSVTNKCLQRQPHKTVLVYIILTIVCIAIDNIYALFGHGVRSASMSLMFLYPLVGGALVYLLIGLLIPWFNHHENYRLFYNIYNSGIAILVVGSLLKGILDIAGTASPYVILFFVMGWSFVTIALVIAVKTRLSG